MMVWAKAFASGVVILLLVGWGVLTHGLLSQNDILARQNEALFQEKASIDFPLTNGEVRFYGPLDKIDEGSRVVMLHHGDKIAVVVEEACNVVISNTVQDPRATGVRLPDCIAGQ